jgi:ADP-heptose:LPS heptosyltransferase
MGDRGGEHGIRSLRVVIGGGLGDCLLHTPFLRHFRKSGQYDHITCMVANGAIGMLDHNPHIDQLIGCEDPDLAIWAAPEVGCDVFSPYLQAQVVRAGDGSIAFRSQAGWSRMPGGNNSSLVRQVARQHGLELADDFLEIFTAPEDEAWAERFITDLSGRPFVVLNRRTAASYKEYPLDRWQSVADAIASRAAVLEFSAPAEALNGVACVWPLQPLRRTAALFRRAGCVVTVDSFAAHLAAAVGTPAVVLFGPSSPRVFGHPVNRNIRLGTCPPCYQPVEVGCRQAECMTQIPPSKVTDEVFAILSGSPP